MKVKFDVRAIVEIVGVIAIVASLYFVGLQMRQDQQLFQSGNAISVLETIIERNNSIVDNSELWIAGNKGSELTEEDFVAYERMINSFNEATFQRYVSAQVVDSQAGGLPAIAEFASFLAKNPGAFKTWNDRENELTETFSKIMPGFRNNENLGSRYRALIRESVDTLTPKD
ncbi:MAG: hypothetical protein DHS20C12_10110 [Pseudohongiella sp.]|nr:MAG: hypothetical protein DHS20C12_10110 [Pseudohongiella sp.]